MTTLHFDDQENGQQLAFMILPPKEPQPTKRYVLCLHGMTESCSIFLGKSSSRFYLLCIDRPGYGESSSPSPFLYTYFNFSLCVKRLLDFLCIPDIECVLGHSSGGPCALAVAHYLGPYVVKKCLLVASDIEYSSPLARNLTDPLPVPIASLNPDAPAQELGFSTFRELHELDLTVYRDSIRRNRTLDGVMNDYRCERTSWGFSFPRGFEMPEARLVVVVGDSDPYLTLAHAEFFQQLAGGIELRKVIVLEGYGHFDIILCPCAFSRLMAIIEE